MGEQHMLCDGLVWAANTQKKQTLDLLIGSRAAQNLNSAATEKQLAASPETLSLSQVFGSQGDKSQLIVII